MSYYEELVDSLTEEQLNKLEEKIKEKRGYVEPGGRIPTTAYGKPFQRDVEEAIEEIEKSDIPEKTKKFLLSLLKKIGISKTGKFFGGEALREGESLSVLPQGNGTVRLSKELGEEDIEAEVRSFLFSGMEHQKKKRSLLDEEE